MVQLMKEKLKEAIVDVMTYKEKEIRDKVGEAFEHAVLYSSDYPTKVHMCSTINIHGEVMTYFKQKGTERCSVIDGDEFVIYDKEIIGLTDDSESVEDTVLYHLSSKELAAFNNWLLSENKLDSSNIPEEYESNAGKIEYLAFRDTILALLKSWNAEVAERALSEHYSYWLNLLDMDKEREVKEVMVMLKDLVADIEAGEDIEMNVI